MHQLTDRVALVTGAGSVGPGWGNGRATAVLLARQGASVFAVDINRSAADETAALIQAEGGRCMAHEADVSDPEQVAEMVARCADIAGRLDVLVNNVGILEPGGPVEASPESWDRVMAVNVRSVMLTCKHALPLMVEQGTGAIVNISSISAAAWLGAAYISYPTSKGAIISFSRHVAVQYGPQGVRCNVVIPGLMKTPMAESAVSDALGTEADAFSPERAGKIPLRSFGDGWDVANACLFLASDEAKYITGAEIVVDGGLTLQLGL